MDYQAFIDRSDDWLKYAIRLNFLQESKKDLIDLRNKALEDERIQKLLNDINDFHSVIVSSHRKPELPIQKLLFLLDLGFDSEISEIENAIQCILENADDQGVYQSLTNIPLHYGGTGTNVFSWSLCDAPWLLLALLKAGLDYHKYVKKGVDYLVSLARNNGFPCATSKELGQFHGPGRRQDCCPYATLIMADLLSYIPEYRDSQAAKNAVYAILDLWENSWNQHPYIFYMGNDFRKLKAPLNWYYIVTVADVLSKYEFVRNDQRFLEMISIIKEKKDIEGFYTPESVYKVYQEWDFGQKKKPSPYLTFLIERILSRM